MARSAITPKMMLRMFFLTSSIIVPRCNHMGVTIRALPPPQQREQPRALLERAGRAFVRAVLDPVEADRAEPARPPSRSNRPAPIRRWRDPGTAPYHPARRA